MRSFIIALQFLTRLRLRNITDASAAEFGASTRWFSLVGVVLGLFYGVISVLLTLRWWTSGSLHELMPEVSTVILLLLPVLFTGGLLYDGFMDTADGVFSGRERERRLEIMKDSRVGSFGVIAFVSLMLLDYALLHDIRMVLLPLAVYCMPIIGRAGMTLVIALFPYARPQGMGKAFAEAADGRTLIVSLLIAALFTGLTGPVGLIALLIGCAVSFLLGAWLTHSLGGVTGDAYGAVETLTETSVLIVWLLAGSLPLGLQSLHIFWS